MFHSHPGYKYFFNQKLAQLKEKNNHLFLYTKTTELIVYLNSLWINLSSIEQDYYRIQEEEEDDDEIKEGKLISSKRKLDANDISLSSNKRSKRIKDKNAPKRSMSAFLMYAKVHRSLVQHEYLSLKNTEISTKLSENWKSLTLEEKKPYLDAEYIERSKYHEDMKLYKERNIFMDCFPSLNPNMSSFSSLCLSPCLSPLLSLSPSNSLWTDEDIIELSNVLFD